jgi:hypothetical protein
MTKPILILFLCFSIFSCRNAGDNSTIVTKQETRTDSLKKNNNTFFLLAKKWHSTTESIAGKEREFKNMFCLYLKPDSTFESNEKPDNYKKGHWELNNDSTFSLYLKALDVYKIIELTDSSLKTELLWIHEKTIITFRHE